MCDKNNLIDTILNKDRSMLTTQDAIEIENFVEELLKQKLKLKYCRISMSLSSLYLVRFDSNYYNNYISFCDNGRPAYLNVDCCLYDTIIKIIDVFYEIFNNHIKLFETLKWTYQNKSYISRVNKNI